MVSWDVKLSAPDLDWKNGSRSESDKWVTSPFGWTSPTFTEASSQAVKHIKSNILKSTILKSIKKSVSFSELLKWNKDVQTIPIYHCILFSPVYSFSSYKMHYLTMLLIVKDSGKWEQISSKMWLTGKYSWRDLLGILRGRWRFSYFFSITGGHFSQCDKIDTDEW